MSGENNNSTIIECEDVLDVSLLVDFKALLEQAAEQDAPIVLEAAKLERIDAASLQLIYSFFEKVESNGGEISWSNPSEQLVSAAELLGMKDALHLA